MNGMIDVQGQQVRHVIAIGQEARTEMQQHAGIQAPAVPHHPTLRRRKFEQQRFENGGRHGIGDQRLP